MPIYFGCFVEVGAVLFPDLFRVGGQVLDRCLQDGCLGKSPVRPNVSKPQWWVQRFQIGIKRYRFSGWKQVDLEKALCIAAHRFTWKVAMTNTQPLAPFLTKNAS